MGQKYALIIGNNEYDDSSLARLITPAADVEGLATVLKATDIGGFDEVVSLVNEPSIRVRREIARFFRDKRRDDLLLLYFSGHGVLDDHGKLHLAVKDTERDLLKGTAIEASFITDVMDGSYSRQQVLILDCCHSGAFARGSKGVTGASVGTAQTFEGTGSGRVVLTATDATQYAWEGDRVIGQADNSVFTHFLIQGLQTGEADINADGRVTLDELYDYAHTQVVKVTPKQNPRKWSFNQEGEIVVAKNPHPPVTRPAELPIELRQAIESPLANVREGAVRELAPLLHGSSAGLALAAREALQHLSEDDSRRVSIAATDVLKALPTQPRVDTKVERRAEEATALKQTRLETETFVRTAEQTKVESSTSAPPAPLTGKRPIGTYGRLAVVCLLLLGFFGPWFQISSCSSQGQPPPPPTIYSGFDAYKIVLIDSASTLQITPQITPLSLVPIAVGVLFCVTLIRLVWRRTGASVTFAGIERVASSLALIALGFVSVLLISLGMWGFWSTYAGTVLAPLNLIVEQRRTHPEHRNLPLWAWGLGGLILLAIAAPLVALVAAAAGQSQKP